MDMWEFLGFLIFVVLFPPYFQVIQNKRGLMYRI